MSDLLAFINERVGTPWRRDPDGNCWALVCEVQERFFHRTLPLSTYPKTPIGRHRAIHGHPAMAAWRQTDAPEHGAVVLMSRGDMSRRVDEHAGVCLMLPAPMVLHVDAPQGACLEGLMQVRFRGWNTTFYVPK